MGRWGWSIAAVMATACLDPLASDEAGYSRYLLAADAKVPSSVDDFELNQKIQLNDGLDPGPVPILEGYAQGHLVHYRDFGEARPMIAPAYALTRCDSKHVPKADGLLSHPWFWDSVPGDADYSPYRGLYLTCITDRYGGELITSMEALSDAVELGLVREPLAPQQWFVLPVTAADVETGDLAESAFYRGSRVPFMQLDTPPTGLPYADKRIQAQNVYELAFESTATVQRVVFAQARVGADGKPNARYAPAWSLVSVVLSDDAPLEEFTQESDLVSVAEDGTLTPASPWVLSAAPAGTTVNRPLTQEAP